MAFLAPFTLLGLSLVALPLLIHLLVRRRGRALDFPSLKFLRETPSFKLRLQRIRQPLLLLLRAAALVLLVMGVARPLLTFRARTPEAVRFIVLDASLSMKTRGRAEAAREQAHAVLGKLAGGERAAVMALSSEAVTLTGPTSDRERLSEAVNRYEPAGGTVSYDAAFREIGRLVENEPRVAARVDIISDFQESGLAAQSLVAVPEGATLSIITHPVGSASERNAFWADESVEKNARGVKLSASEIVSTADGRAGARRAWTLEEAEGSSPSIEWRAEENNQVTGSLKILEPDDFDADDERYFAFAPPRENRTLLIDDGTDATPYLRAALEAAAGEEGAGTVDGRRSLPEGAQGLAAYSLVVMTLHGAASQEEVRALGEYARAGGHVWLLLGRDLDAKSWSSLAGADAGAALPFESVERRSGGQSVRFGAMDTSATQLRRLGAGATSALGAVRVSESYVLTPRASADTVARWSDQTPAIISSRTGEGVITLLATSTERASSELGLSASFPALAFSVRRAASDPPYAPSETIGAAVRLDVAPETGVRITDAKGRVAETQARELVRRPLAYFDEPGIYRLEFAGRRRFVAFNAPASESERALATEEELKQSFPAMDAAGARASGPGDGRDATERSGNVWRYFLAAAFLLMIAEMFVAMRGSRLAEG
jgi:hypothetical protein